MRALISVSDKTGIIALSKELVGLGVELISTGGTYKALKEEGIPVMEVSQITNFPECLDGRIKTLHPHVHAGILAIRENKEHMKKLEELKIETIDMVIVNLYPFKETMKKPKVEREEVIENIDIGGPTMLRSAAKNYQDVAVIVDPKDYSLVIEELKSGKVTLDTKFYLMEKVFLHTSNYDTMIASYLRQERKNETLPDTLTLTYEKVQDMRYGENPHQKAAFYREIVTSGGTLADSLQLHGKELSFNNINDTNGALELLKEFEEPTVVVCKHGNPCGVGSADNIEMAWKKAYYADKLSIFGGIVVLNEEVTLEIAREMSAIFIEVVVAPSYESSALELLMSKKNIRLLQLDNIKKKQIETALDMKKVNGGMIVQTIDSVLYNQQDLKVVTHREPTKEEMEDLNFAFRIVKSVKSNGIALAKNKQSIGIGPGQVNRIWATKQSIEHGKELIEEGITCGGVLASDAFFPFHDCVEEAYKAGITAIIQPGGSVNDKDSIAKCNEYNIAMIVTGMRHFKH